MIENKTTLFFDLDGTLVDSVPDLATSLNATLKDLDRVTFEEDTIRQWIGNGARVLVERGLSSSVSVDPMLDKETVDGALSLFLKHYSKNVCDQTTLYSHVETTLYALKQRGYSLNIITNKPNEFIKPILSKLGIKHLFSTYLGGDSLPEKKPSPQPLLHGARTLKVPIEKCVMIGDSKNDLVAANAANMDSIGVTYGYHQGEDVRSFGPVYAFDKFDDLLSVLA